ncbi:hypothetical protein VPH35_102399 [Triticum aestivum]
MSIREVQKFWFREVDILQFLGISSSPLLSVASSLVAKINSLCKNSGGQQFLLFVVVEDVCMYTCVLEIGELIWWCVRAAAASSSGRSNSHPRYNFYTPSCSEIL